MGWVQKELWRQSLKSIEKISLIAVRLPLSSPYELSFITVKELKTIYAKITFSNGATSWGECTPLYGYSDIDFITAWNEHIRLAELLMRKGGVVLNKDGFNHCALWTALHSNSCKKLDMDKAIPMVGLLQETVNNGLLNTLNAQRDKGYSCFKVKVGVLGFEQDKKRLIQLQKFLFSHEKIRIDANQGLTPLEARNLAEICDKSLVEVFEQPLSIDSWNEMRKLSKESDIDFMLDESIIGMDSLQKAVYPYPSCNWVKLKLMKQGSIELTHQMFKFARDHSLRVIFGNGVSGYLGNYQEALLWHELQKYGEKTANNAIESNGFLKVEADPFSNLLTFDSGTVICNEWRDPDFSDCEIIKEWKVDKHLIN
jgi:L-Ala-D/L-Glu epimerase